MRVNKGQVLIITLFVIGVSMILSFLLLFPVIGQAQRLRNLMYSFQAIANAEKGIEIGNLYAIKGDSLGYLSAINTSNACVGFASDFSGCQRATLTDNSTFISQIDTAFSGNYVIASRNVSQGNYKNVLRILVFLFYTF